MQIYCFGSRIYDPIYYDTLYIEKKGCRFPFFTQLGLEDHSDWTYDLFKRQFNNFSYPQFVLVKPDYEIILDQSRAALKIDTLMMNELGQTDNITEFYNSKTLMKNISVVDIKSDQIAFKLNKPGIYSFNIVSLKGRTLREFVNKDFKSGLNFINMDNNILSKGTYLIEIFGEKQKAVYRLIVN